MTELATKSESEENSNSTTSLKSTSGILVLETPSTRPDSKTPHNKSIKKRTTSKKFTFKASGLFKSLEIDPYFTNYIRHLSPINPAWTHTPPASDDVNTLAFINHNINFSSFLKEFNLFKNHTKQSDYFSVKTLSLFSHAIFYLTGYEVIISGTKRKDWNRLRRTPKSILESVVSTINFLHIHLKHNSTWFSNYLQIFVINNISGKIINFDNRVAWNDTIKDVNKKLRSFQSFYSRCLENSQKISDPAFISDFLTDFIHQYQVTLADYITTWFSFEAQSSIARTTLQLLNFLSLFYKNTENSPIYSTIKRIYDTGFNQLNNSIFDHSALSFTTPNNLKFITSITSAFQQQYQQFINPTLTSINQFHQFFEKLTIPKPTHTYGSDSNPQIKITQELIFQVLPFIRDRHLEYQQSHSDIKLSTQSIIIPDWYIPLTQLIEPINNKLQSIQFENTYQLLEIHLHNIQASINNLKFESYPDSLHEFMHPFVFITHILAPIISSKLNEFEEIKLFLSETEEFISKNASLDEENRPAVGELWKIIAKCNKYNHELPGYSYYNNSTIARSKLFNGNINAIQEFLNKFPESFNPLVTKINRYKLLSNPATIDEFIQSTLHDLFEFNDHYSSELHIQSDITDCIDKFFTRIKASQLNIIEVIEETKDLKSIIHSDYNTQNILTKLRSVKKNQNIQIFSDLSKFNSISELLSKYFSNGKEYLQNLNNIVRILYQFILDIDKTIDTKLNEYLSWLRLRAIAQTLYQQPITEFANVFTLNGTAYSRTKNNFLLKDPETNFYSLISKDEFLTAKKELATIFTSKSKLQLETLEQDAVQSMLEKNSIPLGSLKTSKPREIQDCIRLIHALPIENDYPQVLIDQSNIVFGLQSQSKNLYIEMPISNFDDFDLLHPIAFTYNSQLLSSTLTSFLKVKTKYQYVKILVTLKSLLLSTDRNFGNDAEVHLNPTSFLYSREVSEQAFQDFIYSTRTTKKDFDILLKFFSSLNLSKPGKYDSITLIFGKQLTGHINIHSKGVSMSLKCKVKTLTSLTLMKDPIEHTFDYKEIIPFFASSLFKKAISIKLLVNENQLGFIIQTKDKIKITHYLTSIQQDDTEEVDEY